MEKLFIYHIFYFSGYVYDAVWLFAKALDELIRENESYIEDIRSTRFFNKFSEVIKKTDFNGVSGRINFNNDRNSRLSNIQVSLFFYKKKALVFLLNFSKIIRTILLRKSSVSSTLRSNNSDIRFRVTFV